MTVVKPPEPDIASSSSVDVPGVLSLSFLWGIEDVRLRVRSSGSLLCRRTESESCSTEEVRCDRPEWAEAFTGLAARDGEDMGGT